MFRAIPKGRDEPAVFYVNKDTFDLIEEIAFYLRDVHYKGSIPKVEFHYQRNMVYHDQNNPIYFSFMVNILDIRLLPCVLNFILLRIHL